MEDFRKTIRLRDAAGETIEFAYSESGDGTLGTLLLLHGLCADSGCWERVIPHLNPGLKVFAVDLFGCGGSSASSTEKLSSFDQAILLQEFAHELRLKRIILVAHDVGAAVASLALADSEFRERVEKLILIAPFGSGTELPDYFGRLAANTDENPLVRFDSPDVAAYVLLKESVFRSETIDSRAIECWARNWRKPGVRECLIGAARQLRLIAPEILQTELDAAAPALILWGTEDVILPPSGAGEFLTGLPHAHLELLSDCGHWPMLEQPQKTARLINEFVDGTLAATEKHPAAANVPRPRGRRYYRMRMSRLFDRWAPDTMILMLFIKILQFLKFLGFSPKENGWRKATGVFLRNEYSKFMLAAFHLRYYRAGRIPVDGASARLLLVRRLQEHIAERNELHWAASPGWMLLKRRQIFFTDMIETEFSENGDLLHLKPHFDTKFAEFAALGSGDIELLLQEFCRLYNQWNNLNSLRRAKLLARKLTRWTPAGHKLSHRARIELKSLVDRLLTASYITFEQLPADPEKIAKARFATPDIQTYRHPGWGLLNIIVRFSADWSEADLWTQYHHVPVDGLPMQELLCELKREWGETGPLLYPVPGTPAAEPEIFYDGNQRFRARLFLDFSRFLALRKYLNTHYRTRMGGNATVAGMILWGLMRHPFFQDRKMLFPVDIENGVEFARERELSLIFIRPGKYFDTANPLEGFTRFQREFNRRLQRTRAGKSESYELLQLYSMIHPVFYHLGTYLLPKAMNEMLGTVGLSILTDAEMFLAPLTDLQEDGFMALGNMRVPAVNGTRAGAISICASHRQLKAYTEAITAIASDYPRFLDLNPDLVDPPNGGAKQ